MIDTRAIAQEVQDQLLAAVHKGQEQLRKSQDQVRKTQDHIRKSQDHVRKGQEQVRKGREAVHTAMRTGNELAKAVRPSIPALPTPKLHVASLSTLASPARLRANAQEFVDQVIATQRSLADKAVHVASPLVTESVTRLNHVVGTLQEAARFGQAGKRPAAVTTAAEHVAPAKAPVAESPVAEVSHDAAVVDTFAAKAAPTEPIKPKAARPSVTKASDGKAASTVKTRTTKAGTAKK